MKLYLLTLLLVFGLSLSERSGDLSQNPTYELIKDNLYKDRAGNLYFKTIDRSFEDGPRDRYLTVVYSDDFGKDGVKKMGEVIDSKSFKKLGSQYYRDKNHIYHYFIMADGGTFSILNQANLGTFEVFEHSLYSQDGKSVFYKGSKVKEADAPSFEAVILTDGTSHYGWYGKDKNHYYFGLNTIDEKELTDLLKENELLKLKNGSSPLK